MPKASNRRRIYIVRMDFQKDFIIKYCILVLIAAIFLSLIVYFCCGTTVTTVFKDSRLKIISTNDFLLPHLFWSSVIAVLCAVAVCWRMTLLISNRLAGPLYRLEQDLAKVGQGDLTLNIRVREKDEFQSLARILNDMAGEWRRDIVFIKNKVAELDKSRELSSQDRAALDKLKGALEKYKV